MQTYSVWWVPSWVLGILELLSSAAWGVGIGFLIFFTNKSQVARHEQHLLIIYSVVVGSIALVVVAILVGFLS